MGWHREPIAAPVPLRLARTKRRIILRVMSGEAAIGTEGRPLGVSPGKNIEDLTILETNGDDTGHTEEAEGIEELALILGVRR